MQALCIAVYIATTRELGRRRRMIAAAAEYEYSKSLTGLRLDKIGKGYFRAAYMPVWNSIVPKRSAESS